MRISTKGKMVEVNKVNTISSILPYDSAQASQTLTEFFLSKN